MTFNRLILFLWNPYGALIKEIQHLTKKNTHKFCNQIIYPPPPTNNGRLISHLSVELKYERFCRLLNYMKKVQVGNLGK